MSSVLVERRGHVALLLIDNPPLNLMTTPLLRELHRAIVELHDDEALRSVVVGTRTARAFSAGSDMREFASLGADASEQKILIEDLMLRRLANLPMPTVAAIDGPALGGGLELALACDLRIAHADALLGTTEARIGGLAGSGSQRLTKLIGPARTKQLLFTAVPISAARAEQWGLVNEVTSGSALERAHEFATLIASRGPSAIRLAKELVDAAVDLPLDAGLVRSTIALQKVFDGAELDVGSTAFFAKTEPVFP